MIPGQMSLYGYWLDNFSYGAQMKREGYTNVYEAMPDEEGPVQVVDHAGNRYKMRAVMSFGSMAFSGNDRGYNICWWRKAKG